MRNHHALATRPKAKSPYRRAEVLFAFPFRGGDGGKEMLRDRRDLQRPEELASPSEATSGFDSIAHTQLGLASQLAGLRSRNQGRNGFATMLPTRFSGVQSKSFFNHTQTGALAN